MQLLLSSVLDVMSTNFDVLISNLLQLATWLVKSFTQNQTGSFHESFSRPYRTQFPTPPPFSTVLIIGLSYIPFVKVWMGLLSLVFAGFSPWRDDGFFSKGFFYLFRNHVGFVPNYIYMLLDIYWFTYSKPPLHPCNENSLNMTCNLLNVLLNLVFQILY